jgi:molecular chaperone HtpG
MDMDMFAPAQTLTLNENNALVQYLLSHKDSEHSELFAKQLYDLAALANAPLKPEAMTAFISRSNEIMMLLAK